MLPSFWMMWKREHKNNQVINEGHILQKHGPWLPELTSFFSLPSSSYFMYQSQLLFPFTIMETLYVKVRELPRDGRQRVSIPYTKHESSFNQSRKRDFIRHCKTSGNGIQGGFCVSLVLLQSRTQACPLFLFLLRQGLSM